MRNYRLEKKEKKKNKIKYEIAGKGLPLRVEKLFSILSFFFLFYVIRCLFWYSSQKSKKIKQEKKKENPKGNINKKQSYLIITRSRHCFYFFEKKKKNDNFRNLVKRDIFMNEIKRVFCFTKYIIKAKYLRSLLHHFYMI